MFPHLLPLESEEWLVWRGCQRGVSGVPLRSPYRMDKIYKTDAEPRLVKCKVISGSEVKYIP